MTDQGSGGGRWGINLETVHCPECGEKLPALRVPDTLHQLMWGGWTCPQCGCRMDQWGRAVESKGKGQ